MMKGSKKRTCVAINEKELINQRPRNPSLIAADPVDPKRTRVYNGITRQSN